MNEVRVSRPNATTCIGMILAGTLVVACQPKAKPPAPQPTTRTIDRWGVLATAKRVHQLAKVADTLARDSRALPGHDAAEHSRIMQRIFTDMLQAIPLLDTSGSRVTAQRMTTIQNARAKLAAGSVELNMDPTIDTALLSIHAELSDISHGDSFDQADFAADLDKLSASINRLDFEHDPSLHRVDVTDVVGLINRVVNKMSTSLSDRLTLESPTTAPATTQPSSATTGPTTAQ